VASGWIDHTPQARPPLLHRDILRASSNVTATDAARLARNACSPLPLCGADVGPNPRVHRWANAPRASIAGRRPHPKVERRVAARDSPGCVRFGLEPRLREPRRGSRATPGRRFAVRLQSEPRCFDTAQDRRVRAPVPRRACRWLVRAAAAPSHESSSRLPPLEAANREPRPDRQAHEQHSHRSPFRRGFGRRKTAKDAPPIFVQNILPRGSVSRGFWGSRASCCMRRIQHDFCWIRDFLRVSHADNTSSILVGVTSKKAGPPE
jgi:hypothetical protein